MVIEEIWEKKLTKPKSKNEKQKKTLTFSFNEKPWYKIFVEENQQEHQIYNLERISVKIKPEIISPVEIKMKGKAETIRLVKRKSTK